MADTPPPNSEARVRVTAGRALRHLIVFQLKLAADAFRDLLLSPLSVVVFIIDALNKPVVEDSLYLRLMLMGRRSDRMINLFDEYTDTGEFRAESDIHAAPDPGKDDTTESSRRPPQ